MAMQGEFADVDFPSSLLKRERMDFDQHYKFWQKRESGAKSSGIIRS